MKKYILSFMTVVGIFVFFGCSTESNMVGEHRYVYHHPDESEITADTPVILFLEGGGKDIHIQMYSGIMKFLAKKGYFVIGGETGDGYDIKYYVTALDAAVKNAKEKYHLNFNKLIVMGHSQGGGDVFYVMKHFQDKGYGNDASLALSIDGWFAFDMNQADLRALKGRVNFLQMNGVEGTGTDPRIKLTIWNLVNKTNRKFLTLPENDHMYVAGDYANIEGKTDLTDVIYALVSDTVTGGDAEYSKLPDDRKSSYEEIRNSLKDKSEYHGGDCAGVQYNAKSELKDYDINYCEPERYR